MRFHLPLFFVVGHFWLYIETVKSSHELQSRDLKQLVALLTANIFNTSLHSATAISAYGLNCVGAINEEKQFSSGDET